MAAKVSKRALPTFSFEKDIFKKGYKFVAGVDEVGRGCFAGPVVAGCVIFDKNTIFTLKGCSLQGTLQGNRGIVINDSKKLTSKKRERASVWIRGNAVAFGIGSASVAQINRFGIKKASEIAFRKAIAGANLKLKTKDNRSSVISFMLIDAFYIPYVKGLRRKNQKAIIRGDTKSVSIAAASIIAKVYRDSLMRKLSAKPKYRRYGWSRNKGYGTLQHRKAIRKYGPTRQHRKQFVETFLRNFKNQITKIKQIQN